MKEIYPLLGTLGLGLIECSYVPQILRLHKLQEAEEFALLFPVLNFLGRVCAIIYAFSRNDQIMIRGLFVGIVLRAVLVTQVLLYRYRRRLQLKLQQDAVSI